MRAVAVALIVLCGVAGPAAQAPPPLAFDVASVKPAPPTRSMAESLTGLTRRSPGQWQLLGLTLQNAIVIAYPEFHLPGLLVGGPEWIKEARFDLQARMSPAATHADVQMMFRHLLEDRFTLRTHVEQRTLDVYLLTLKTPGRFGPGLTPAPSACVVWRMTGGRLPDECDLYRRRGGEGAFTISAGTMSDLISAMTLTAVAPPSMRMTSAIDRPVVDRTGLEGYFQFIGPSPMGGRGNAGSDGSFFTLLEEQLGLKLTRAREIVNVLVIDSVSMPEPD